MTRAGYRYAARFAAVTLAVVFAALMSLSIGTSSISPGEVWAALTQFDVADQSHVIIWELRVPRVIAAIFGGGALGLAGALMQTLTRNPLADPGIIGVNGGAAAGVVIAIWGLGMASQAALAIPALIGTGLAAAVVLVLAGSMQSRGPDPVRLVLAGAAVGAFFLAVTWTILVISRESLDIYRFWVLGGFANVHMDDLLAVAPLYIVALALGALAAALLDPLVLGDETARALGANVGLVRLISVAAVVLLCGVTVSLAGPIAFIGLVVPHLARPFFGQDIRALSLGAFAIGAFAAILADVTGRVLLPSMEVEAGVMMALIGGPALVILVRSFASRHWT